MGSSDGDAAVAAEAYQVGPLDVFLLISFVGFFIYWFFGKKEAKPEITGLAGLRRINQLPPMNTDTSGFLAKMKKSGNLLSVFL